MSEATIYSYAELEKWVRETRRTAEDQKRFEIVEAQGAREVPHLATDCPVCGWPATGRGFVRAPAMPGEWAFGKLFKCPRCWPR